MIPIKQDLSNMATFGTELCMGQHRLNANSAMAGVHVH